MAKPRIIIERENYGPLVKSAKEDGRSQVKQLNWILAEYFRMRRENEALTGKRAP